MPFKKILAAIDGSACSQIAADYTFWLASKLGASISVQHVIDPRILDQIIAPEFAKMLGFDTSIHSSEKVYAAMEKVGALILDLFKKQVPNNIDCETFLDVGWISEQISQRATAHDLVVIGHRGHDSPQIPGERTIGSVAERVVLQANKPVLVALRPLEDIKNILVAFDGSEASRGALLAGEALAIKTDKQLQALTVIPSVDKLSEAHITVEQGSALLHQFKNQNIFKIAEGQATKTILDYANSSGALLVVGAYGYRSHEENVLGSTTTGIIRRSRTSLLVYRL